jgi:hypothetical protein
MQGSYTFFHIEAICGFSHQAEQGGVQRIDRPLAI